MDEEFYREVCQLIADRSKFTFKEVWECYQRVKMLDVVIILVLLAGACDVSLTEASRGIEL